MNRRDVVDEMSSSIIQAMGTRMGDVTRAVQQELLSKIPELRGDAQLTELLRDSVEGNIDTIFAAIQHGIVVDEVSAPTAALEYARRLAQHNVSPNALVRAYRLGQQELLRMTLEEIRTREIDPVLALETFESVNIVASGYIDWISEQVVEVYQLERDRWRESRGRILAQRVQQILAGGTLPAVDELTVSIRYPLERQHLAVIMWYPESGEHRGELTGMDQFLRGAADHLGASDRPLFVALDRLTGWGWIPLHRNVSQSAVATLESYAERYDSAPALAIGVPQPGLAGFRRSHELAEYARGVALSGHREGRITVASSQRGVMIAAMLDGDLDTADQWVREVLGDLASPNESDAGLRETLSVFLECGSSFKDAAARLHLHSNTVKYRVRRAEERRGRPLDDGRLDVEIALLLCERFPAITGPDWHR